MEQVDLQLILQDHLSHFNDEGVDINENTIHNQVLSYDDSYPGANSAEIYPPMVRWTLKRNGVADKALPSGWMGMSVKEVVSKLLILTLILFSSFTAKSQLTVSLGAAKTELKNSAIAIGISYVRSFDSIWNRQTFLHTGNHSLFTIAPQANIITGNQDAFSSINIKAVGLLMFFQTKKINNYVTPNSGKTFHCFPMSVGIETNNLFNTVNGIAEIGWVPWYQVSQIPDWMKHIKLGIFLQGGYKWYVDSTGKNAVGGQIDQSLEAPDHKIFRAKTSFGIDTKNLTSVNGLGIGLVGSADAWYDIVNGVWYHHIEGAAKFYTSKTDFITVSYSKGSGAPNFNLGDQYGIGLTVIF